MRRALYRITLGLLIVKAFRLCDAVMYHDAIRHQTVADRLRI
jgi:hypothetical protein